MPSFPPARQPPAEPPQIWREKSWLWLWRGEPEEETLSPCDPTARIQDIEWTARIADLEWTAQIETLDPTTGISALEQTDEIDALDQTAIIYPRVQQNRTAGIMPRQQERSVGKIPYLKISIAATVNIRIILLKRVESYVENLMTKTKRENP